MMLNRMNHNHRCADLPILSPLSVFPCSPLTKPSPPVFQSLNSLSITNCVAPPRPSPPLFLPLSSIDRSVFKHRLKNTACHSPGLDEREHSEREREREEGRGRQTERRWVRWRQNGRNSPAYLVKPLSRCSVCVFWGLQSCTV